METDARALTELIAIVNAEGPVSPAMQAIMTHAIRISAAARTVGHMLVEAGSEPIPLCQPAIR